MRLLFLLLFIASISGTSFGQNEVRIHPSQLGLFGVASPGDIMTANPATGGGLWQTQAALAPGLNYWIKTGNFLSYNNRVGINTTSPERMLHVISPEQGYWNFNANALSGSPPYPVFENNNPGAYDSGFEIRMRTAFNDPLAAAYFGVAGTGPWVPTDLNTMGTTFYIVTRKQGTGVLSNSLLIDGFGGVHITSNPQTSNPNGYKLRVDGSFRSGVASIGDEYTAHKLNITNDVGLNRPGYSPVQLAKYSNYGYNGGGYGLVEIGDPAKPIAFGVDLSNNLSGSFTGAPGEIWWPEGFNFGTKNAANTSYNRFMLHGKNGNIGINTGGIDPNAKLYVDGSIRFVSLTNGIIAANANGFLYTETPANIVANGGGLTTTTVFNGDINGTSQALQIIANAVTTAEIATGAVTTTDIADGAVTPAKLEQGTLAAVSSNYSTWGTERMIRVDAAAASRTVTVTDAMSEGITYLVRCTNNATNTVTFQTGTGVTGMGLDQNNTLNLTSFVSGGSAGTGVLAPFKIYHLTRIGSTVWIN